jgi:hypothetical protein
VLAQLTVLRHLPDRVEINPLDTKRPSLDSALKLYLVRLALQLGWCRVRR